MSFQNLIPIGVMVIFFGFVLVFLGVAFSGRKTRYGVTGFIGPFPFGFASDPKTLRLIILISVVAVIIFIILPLIKYLK